MFAQIISLTIIIIVLSAGLLPVMECQRDVDRNAFDILRYQNMPGADGNYSFGYKTSNGISVEEKGFVKNPEAPRDQQINVKTGCYSYTTPEGAFVSVVYVADELGYRPKTRITYPQDTVRHQQHLQDPCGRGSSPSLTPPLGTSTTASPIKTTTPRKGRGLDPSIFNQGSRTTSNTPTGNKGLTSGSTTTKPSNTNNNNNNIVQGLTTPTTPGKSGPTLSTTSTNTNTTTTTTTTEPSIPSQDKTTISRQPKDSLNCLCQSFTFELFDQSSVVVDYSRNSELPTVTIYPYGSQNAYTRAVSPVDLSSVQTL